MLGRGLSIPAGRMKTGDVEAAVNWLGKPNSISAFLCGPLSLIQSAETILLSLSLPKAQIHYEKWS